MSLKATARAHANIAFIKYWGNRNDELRLPSNSSLSMNLGGLYTETMLVWDEQLDTDTLELNGNVETGIALKRVQNHLEQLRTRLDIQKYAHVQSHNNFPMGAGIASSASSFAALTFAAIAAAQVSLSEKEITALARLGSGSAARSISDGYVEWYAADTHEKSFAESIAPSTHWELVDVIAVISQSHKTVGSTEGHHSALSSDLQDARVKGVDNRLSECKQAILTCDFEAFANVVELDSNLMHSVMMTSKPPLFYWLPGSILVMREVTRWRQEGIPVCYTLDAGPNVHCLCLSSYVDTVVGRLKAIPEVVDVRVAHTGSGAYLVAPAT
jgi:diphosphomevalonate decarboxylase